MSNNKKDILKYIDIESVKSDVSNCYPVEVEESRDGKKVFRVQKGGQRLYVGSKYNVSKDTEYILKAADALIKMEVETIIVAGLGNGEYINPLREKIDRAVDILIVEFNAGIAEEFIKSGDYRQIDSENVFLFLHNERNKEGLGKKINEHAPEKTGVIVYPTYNNVYEEESDALIKLSKQRLTDGLAEVATNAKFGNLWLRTGLRLLAFYVAKSYAICDFKNIYKNVPAVVVSAGPSLKKNVHLLKEVQDKFVIIAGNRTLEAVIENDAEPDFWTSVDPDEIVLFHVENVLHKTRAPYIYLNSSSDKINRKLEELHSQKDPGFFFNYYLNRLIYSFNLGKSIDIAEKFKNFKELLSSVNGEYRKFAQSMKSEGLQIFNTPLGSLAYCCGMNADRIPIRGGSVAHFCVGIAEFMGCNPIILIGQDLALDKEFSRQYSDVASHGEALEELSTVSDESENDDDLPCVEDIYGDMVKTTLTLEIFLRHMEEIVKLAKDIKFIDATEGGAKIKGTEIMTFREVIELYGDIKKEPLDFSKFKTIGEYSGVESFISDTKEEAKQIASLMKKALSLNEKIHKYNLLATKNTSSLMKKLSEIDDKIKDLLCSTVQSLAVAVISDACREAIHSKDLIILDEDTDRVKYEKLYGKQKLLYSGILNACNSILSEIEIIENGEIPLSFVYEKYRRVDDDENSVRK